MDLNRIYRFVAVDLEMANNNIHSICQCGLAYVNKRGNHIRSTDLLVNPEEEFGEYQMKVHGIRPADVSAAPKFPEALELLKEAIGTLPVLHHGPSEKQAIDAACQKYGLEVPEFNWINSVTIAKHAWPELPGHGLKRLADFMSYEFKHHDAKEDAKFTAKAILKAEDDTGLPFDEIIGHRQRRPMTP